MARTQLAGTAILDGSLQRDDFDVTTPGQAVITKVIAGDEIELSSTGGDPGTGDVTVKVSDAVKTHVHSAHAPSDAQKNEYITKQEIENKLIGTIGSHTHKQVPRFFALDASTTSQDVPYIAGTNGENAIHCYDGTGAGLRAFILLPADTLTGGSEAEIAINDNLSSEDWFLIYSGEYHPLGEGNGAVVMARDWTRTVWGVQNNTRQIELLFPSILVPYAIVMPKGHATRYAVCKQADGNTRYHPIDGHGIHFNRDDNGDGWGNHPVKNSEGYLKRYTLSEEEYSYIYGRGIQYVREWQPNLTRSLTTLIDINTQGEYQSDENIQVEYPLYKCLLRCWGNAAEYFINGHAVFTIASSTFLEGDTIRLLLGGGQTHIICLGSAPIYQSPAHIEITADDQITTTGYYHNSVSDTYFLANLQESGSNRDYLELTNVFGIDWKITGQDFLSYMTGKLAWDKIDFTGFSIGKNVDGGSPDSVYLASQVIDGGNP